MPTPLKFGIPSLFLEQVGPIFRAFALSFRVSKQSPFPPPADPSSKAHVATQGSNRCPHLVRWTRRHYLSPPPTPCTGREEKAGGITWPKTNLVGG